MIYNPDLNARVIYADPEPSPAGEYDAVVLKNIDPATEAGRIFIDLERLGYRVHSIRNGMNATTRRTAPMFFVELVKRPFNASIFGIKRIANQNVVIERYFTSSELVRCSICQSLDHLTEECSRSPICASCSGPHHGCITGRGFTPTCHKCGGRHSSSYKVCNIYRQRFLEAKKERVSKVKEMNANEPEGLRRLGRDQESMVVQYDDSLSGSSSNDSSGGMDSEMEYPMSFTHDVIGLDYLKKNLKLTMDHYLSMHYVSNTVIKHNLDLGCWNSSPTKKLFITIN